MKFAFVSDHRTTWPVAVLCRVLGITPAGYYAHRNRPPSPRTQRREALAAEVRAAFTSGREVFGSPRVTRTLQARGLRCCENTVARVMRRRACRRFGGGGCGPPKARPSPSPNRPMC